MEPAYYMGKRGMNFKRMIKNRQKQDALRHDTEIQHEQREKRLDEHTNAMEKNPEEWGDEMGWKEKRDD